MSFSWLSPWAFVAGLGALAAILFALQRLRVRHRTLIVPTTIFWREALEETRARVFVQRFRHPWTYVFLLAIAALLWLAVAGPRTSEDRGGEHVLVLDASAVMSVEGRFDAALDRLVERASTLPRATTRVLVAGSAVRTLLDRDEDLPLLERRAAALRPEACPATLERALESLSLASAVPGGRVVELFGDSPVDPALVARLAVRADAPLEVRRAVLPPRPPVANAGVVALGVAESASGNWRAVDVFARVRAPSASDPRALLGGQPVDVTWTEESPASAGSASEFVARLDDVEADGRPIVIVANRDAPDAIAADDRAQRTLPARAPIRVAFAPTVAPNLREMLALDAGLEFVDDAALCDLVVRRADDAFGLDRPALVLTDAAREGAAFVVSAPGGVDADRALRDAYRDLGLGEIDAVALATAVQRPVTLEFRTAETRAVHAWEALFGTQFDFAATRACPLFLARTVRFLADTPSVPIELAAGRALAGDAGTWVEPDGRRVDALGAPVRVPVAGSTRDARGAERSVALLDADVSALRSDAASLPAPTRVPASPWREPLTWILLAALALLLLEWWWLQKERIA